LQLLCVARQHGKRHAMLSAYTRETEGLQRTVARDVFIRQKDPASPGRHANQTEAISSAFRN
jgi:hypothetical protein